MNEFRRHIDTLVIHCSDTDTGDADSIRRYHIDHNKWLDIGYHYVITREGVIQPGRPEKFAGAHARGHNANSLGVCLVGKSHFTDEQLDSLRFLVRDLSSKYGIKNNNIKCHYELDDRGKSCPNMPAFLLRWALKF